MRRKVNWISILTLFGETQTKKNISNKSKIITNPIYINNKCMSTLWENPYDPKEISITKKANWQTHIIGNFERWNQLKIWFKLKNFHRKTCFVFDKQKKNKRKKNQQKHLDNKQLEKRLNYFMSTWKFNNKIFGK